MIVIQEKHNTLKQEFHDLEECHQAQGTQLLVQKGQYVKDVTTWATKESVLEYEIEKLQARTWEIIQKAKIKLSN